MINKKYLPNEVKEILNTEPKGQKVFKQSLDGVWNEVDTSCC